MPAPSVVPVASSSRMKAPVVRSSAYGSTASGEAVRSVTRPMSFSRSSATGSDPSVRTSSRSARDVTTALTVRVVCLSSTLEPARSGASAIQQTVASRCETARGGASAATSMSPRLTSSSSLRRTVTACRATATSSGPSKVSRPATVVRRPDGSATTSSPTRRLPLATVPA